ncbi:hypothetical protein AI2839V1_2086 [Enterobacter cloacae]|nr:hypothetical protein AI2839V1_2086 [Enterobacter cloacae]CAH5253489.1 hypothetical protein AI2839V1_2086 [Enterobacter cloacae]
MLDYRFPTALQMVLSVAMAEQLGERSTSAILAYGLEANPSFIRKLMVPLTRDGIIVSTLGRNGSIHLGRPPEEITLRDIYLSVIEDKKLWASRPDVPARCVVSANACWYFKSISEEAEQASLAVLARHTVASALEAVKNADSSGWDPLPDLIAQGTVAKLAMRQPFVLFKGLTFQKLCLPGAFRPGDHHNKMLRPGLCVVHASPQYL